MTAPRCGAAAGPDEKRSPPRAVRAGLDLLPTIIARPDASTTSGGQHRPTFRKSRGRRSHEIRPIFARQLVAYGLLDSRRASTAIVTRKPPMKVPCRCVSSRAPRLWRRRRRLPTRASDAKAQVEFGINVAQRGLWREAIYRWEKAVELDPDLRRGLQRPRDRLRARRPARQGAQGVRESARARSEQRADPSELRAVQGNQ